MRRIILASHGDLAVGMRGTIEMILGKREDLVAFSLTPEGKTTALVDQITKEIAGSRSDETIIVTDLIGGSVHTALAVLVGEPGIHLLSGMNLSLLLELLLLPDGEIQAEQIYSCMAKGKKSIIYMNDEMKKYKEEKENDEWLNC
jgi:mannose/fructose-specific phosphotransferase system component IIA